jgi:hypothetical protein
MLQVIVPDHLRGRVMSIYASDRGLMPVGALMAGVSAQTQDRVVIAASLNINLV